MNSSELKAIYGDKIDRRTQEYSNAIDYYLSNTKEPITFVENAAVKLTLLYFRWHYTLVKPFVKDKCDRYKVASITELAVCHNPLITSDVFPPDQVRAINADFAFYCALNIMDNFNEDEESIHFGPIRQRLFQGSNTRLEERMEKLVTNHMLYLQTLNAGESPAIIVNAFCLEMFEMYYSFRWQPLPV